MDESTKQNPIGELSRIVFSPDGRSLAVYQDSYKKLEKNNPTEKMAIRSLVKQHNIQKIPSYMFVEDKCKECMNATKRDVDPFRNDPNMQPEDFTYYFMNEIYRTYYNKNEKTFDSKKKNEREQQHDAMKNVDTKSGVYKQEDSTLYNFLIKRIPDADFEDESYRDESRYIISYVKYNRALAANKKIFADAEKYAEKNDFISSDFFENNNRIPDKSEILEVHCKSNQIGYCTVPKDIMIFKCADCGQEFSSLLYSKCPACRSENLKIDSIKNGSFKDVDVSTLNGIVDGLKNKKNLDVDGIVKNLSDSQYRLYERYYKETVDRLDTKMQDLFVTPLDKLRKDLNEGRYSDERLASAKQLAEDFAKLSPSERNKLPGFSSDLSKVLNAFMMEHDRKEVNDFVKRVNESLENPSRPQLEGLLAELKTKPENIVAQIRNKVGDSLEKGLKKINKKECRECIDTINKTLVNDFSDISVAESRLKSAYQRVDALHPESREELENSGAMSILKKFEDDLNYRKAEIALKPLMKMIDMLEGSNPDGMVADYDDVYREYSNLKKDSLNNSILLKNGYCNKMETIRSKVHSELVSRNDARVSHMIRNIPSDDLNADSEAIVSVDRLLDGLSREMVDDLRGKPGYEALAEARKNVESRMARKDAEDLDAEISALEGLDALDAFEDRFNKLKSRIKNLNNGGTMAILRNEYGYETRAENLEKQYMTMKTKQYSNAFVEHLVSAMASFDTVPADKLTGMADELNTMKPEARDFVMSRIGNEGLRSLEGIVAAKPVMDDAAGKMDSVMTEHFSEDLGPRIESAIDAVSKVPEPFSDRMNTSARGRKFSDFVNDYTQWQQMHMVKTMMDGIDSLEDGRVGFGEIEARVSGLYDKLLPANRKILDDRDFMTRLRSYKNRPADNTKKLERLANACEEDFGTDTLSEFMNCYNNLTEEEKGKDTTEILRKRVERIETEYWTSAAQNISDTVKRVWKNRRKMSEDDRVSIAEAFKLMVDMPERFSKSLEKGVDRKLRDLMNRR